MVTIDGDGQHNSSEIPSVLGNIMNNGYDISIGYRAGNKTEMPKWRRVGKRILDHTTGFGNGGFVTDSQCGFRAFNKKAVKGLTSRLNGGAFNVESEQLIKAHELGLNVVNTRVSCKYENLDTSTKNPASHGFSVLKYVLWLIAEKRPLLFIGIPGFVLVILAILVSIFLIVGVIGMFMGLVLNVLPNIIKRFKIEDI